MLLFCLVLIAQISLSAFAVDNYYSLLPDHSVDQKPDADIELIRETAEKSLLPFGYLSSSMLYTLAYKRYDVTGLTELAASTSGQFSLTEYPFIARSAGQRPLVIIDVRSDAHVFANNDAVLCPEISIREESGFAKSIVMLSLKLKVDQRLVTTKARKDFGPIKILSAETEESFVSKNGAAYYRIADVGLEKQLRVLQAIVDNLPGNVWLHIHDRDGKTAPFFLLAYDIIKNSTKVRFDDIISRNELMNKNIYDEKTKIIFKNFYEQQEKHK